MFCDIHLFSGEPFDGDPRYVLKRNLERAREKGFTFFVGPEMEFFYFGGRQHAEPLDSAGYFDLTAHDIGSQLRKQTVLRLESMGIPVEYSFHENGPSQHEIDLRYTDALTMADNVMTFRLVVKEVAHDHGMHATFMPKPIGGAFGSGMHTHLSLFEGDVNAFHDPGDGYGLSKVAKHFIAGLLEHSAEICAVTNQWVNSYKRLVPGYEAPVYRCWARNNRSALVRVPLPKRGKMESTRIEFRAPDPSCNPYLAFSVMLAAGLKGIEEGYELPTEATDNIYELTDEERLAEGIRALPGSLKDALDVMERSELVAEALGEHVFEYFLANKRREWSEYKTYVTPFEIERYLGTL
jgi:glutamine synthetase